LLFLNRLDHLLSYVQPIFVLARW